MRDTAARWEPGAKRLSRSRRAAQLRVWGWVQELCIEWRRDPCKCAHGMWATGHRVLMKARPVCVRVCV